MGIKHFWAGYMMKKHKDCIKTIATRTRLPEEGIDIDTLALDLNGIFHPAAQKIFRYGAHAPKLRLLTRKNQVNDTRSIQKLRLACFRQVCTMIDELVEKVQPRKRLLLCVDGVAGASKCSQQRSRRFKSAKEKETSTQQSKFDSAEITPGTKFMHHLNKYIDWHIRQKIQCGDWAHLDVVFSSEKVPGEGEHTCINLFKHYCDPSEYCMIYGLDADLVMLCLTTGLKNIYIYRDNMYNDKERYVVDVGKLAKNIERELGTASAVVDFIFMCFMVGNDFLPQIPGLEIMNNGIEIMTDLYRKTCTPFGLINTHDYTIRTNTLLNYFKELSVLELEAMKDKYTIRNKYHPDELMEDYFEYSNMYEEVEKGRIESIVECDFEGYKRAYYQKKLGIDNRDDTEQIQQLCREYIKGLQWVIQYYCVGIPSWTWCFPYNYAPFMDDLYRCEGYIHRPYLPTQPLEPFEQLLAVLPPQSKHLLPAPLQKLMTNENSPLYHFYPEQFTVDLSGKRAEWEGIAQLPIMDFRLLRKTYKEVSKHIDRNDRVLNRRKKTIRYIQTEDRVLWKSYYGDIIDCKVEYEMI